LEVGHCCIPGWWKNAPQRVHSKEPSGSFFTLVSHTAIVLNIGMIKGRIPHMIPQEVKHGAKCGRLTIIDTEHGGLV